MSAAIDRCKYDGHELTAVVESLVHSGQQEYLECEDCGRRYREQTRLVEIQGPDGRVICARLDPKLDTRCAHPGCITFRREERRRAG